MINENYYLIAFDSTHAAMAAEAFFKETRARVKLIPIPSVISAGCGFGIKIAKNEQPLIQHLLKDSIFERVNFYEIAKEKGDIIAKAWVI